MIVVYARVGLYRMVWYGALTTHIPVIRSSLLAGA